MIYEYNGIKMKMVKTNIIEFNAVFTEDGTTYLYTNYRIDIQAVINPLTMSYISDPGTNEPRQVPGYFPATTIRTIRHTLLQPRKLLIIKDEINDGNILLKTPDNGFSSDAKSGPTPRGCSLINISGAKTVLIRWVCEGWINECQSPDSGTSNPPYILSNRWTDQMTIDKHQLTTRTFAGKTIFNQAYLVKEFQDDNIPSLPPAADYYRNNPIFPNVANGFQRKTVDIVQNESGNELTWRVVDQEMMWTLGDTTPDFFDEANSGSGILEVDGKQTIASFKPEANSTALVGNTINIIQMRAIGSYFSNQWVMIQRLLELVSTLTPELMVIGQNRETGYWIADANISRSLGQKEKWVELNIQIMCPAPTEVTGILGNANVLPIANDIWYAINEAIDQNKGISPPLYQDNYTRGSSAVPLLTQYLTESCQKQPDMPTVDSYVDADINSQSQIMRASSSGASFSSGIPSQRESEREPNNETQIDKVPEPGEPIAPGMSSNYNAQGINFTACSIEMDQLNITGIKQIPITGPVPTGTTSGGDGDPTIPGEPSPISEATCGIVQVHLPLSRYRYRGVAERVGSFPTVPSPLSKYPDEFVLLSWHISPFYTAPGYDGITPVYRCDFEYVYAKVRGHDPSNPRIPLGQLPFSLITSQTFGKEVFSDDIINFNADNDQNPETVIV